MLQASKKLFGSGLLRAAAPRQFASITRLHNENPNMNQTVIHGETIYLAGQVPKEWVDVPIGEQVGTTLEKVDALLAEVGSDKSKLLSAQIWLKSMDDFDAMNKIWQKWLIPGQEPVRACVQAEMAHPDIKFEVMVIAAK
eukprot:CAMPEP_0197852260 /NCGR_PEP_ID=MMETSP1438-20131217/20081_1 /TAXON_ID=1461541 /ORGANISM="Pterosperma sp., Strain CCMP1384" /LENGTH=139 /DNA_ID=CAMNT_0043466209 /DNA_START=151 /DNA_END=570 /DNA_ORIENTATION=-